MLDSLGVSLGLKLSIFQCFFNVFGWSMLGFLGNSFGVCGHPWGPLGAILSRLGRFLGPPCGHLCPCWALFGASLAVLGAQLEPSWASYGPDRAPLGSSLGFFRAMLCHIEHHWSLPGGILVQTGVPRVPVGLLGAILKPIGGSVICSTFPMRGRGEI